MIRFSDSENSGLEDVVNEFIAHQDHPERIFHFTNAHLSDGRVPGGEFNIPPDEDGYWPVRVYQVVDEDDGFGVQELDYFLRKQIDMLEYHRIRREAISVEDRRGKVLRRYKNELPLDEVPEPVLQDIEEREYLQPQNNSTAVPA